MKWNEQFTQELRPAPEQIADFVANPLWQALCEYIEQAYGSTPVEAYSICSGAPGWNIKYRKGGRALCTLYPAAGFFTCLISIGSKEAMEAELVLSNCTEYVRELYWGCKPMNGGRWLMIDVKSPEILSDVKALIGTRAKPKTSL